MSIREVVKMEQKECICCNGKGYITVYTIWEKLKEKIRSLFSNLDITVYDEKKEISIVYEDGSGISFFHILSPIHLESSKSLILIDDILKEFSINIKKYGKYGKYGNYTENNLFFKFLNP